MTNFWSRIMNFKLNLIFVNRKCLKLGDKSPKIKKVKNQPFYQMLWGICYKNFPRLIYNFNLAMWNQVINIIIGSLNIIRFPCFFGRHTFVDFKFLISRKWTVFFNNRNFYFRFEFLGSILSKVPNVMKWLMTKMNYIPIKGI